METRQYLGILWRRKWIIVVTMLAAVGVAILGSYLQQPVFSAAATIRVAQGSRGSIQYVDAMYAERLMNTYRDLLRSRPFLASAIERLSLPTTVEALAKQIKVDVVLDTELLKVTAEDADPAQAQRVANTLATLFIEQSRSLYSGSGESILETLRKQLAAVEADLEQNRTALQTLRMDPRPEQTRLEELAAKVSMGEEIYASLLRQYDDMRLVDESRANSVTLAEPASLPVEPIKPRKLLNLILGSFIGMLCGIGLAFLFESLDPVLHSRRDLEAASDIPILASIPNFKTLRETRKGLTAVDASVYSPIDEAFGILREALHPALAALPVKTLLIASPEPEAGKSTVLANLAVAIAHGGQRVILVDADLRRPVLHDIFGLSNAEGLTTVLQGGSDVVTLLQNTDIPELRVLTSGPAIPDAARLAGLAKLTDLLDRLLGQADIVLVDGPPILTVADASHLATKVGGVLVVAAREQATAESIRRAVQQLQRLGAQVVGLVYNKAHASDDHYHYYYAYTRSDRRRTAARRRAALAPSARVGAAAPGTSGQTGSGRERGFQRWFSPGVIFLIVLLAVCMGLFAPGAARLVRGALGSKVFLARPLPTAALTDQSTAIVPSPEPSRLPEAGRFALSAVSVGQITVFLPSPEPSFAQEAVPLSAGAIPTTLLPVAMPSAEPAATPEESGVTWSAIFTSLPPVPSAMPRPDPGAEARQLAQDAPALQQGDTRVMPTASRPALITPESRPESAPVLAPASTQDSRRSGASLSRLEIITPTVASQAAIGLPAPITLGLTLPVKGIIASESSSKFPGVFVLKEPRLWKSEVIWLPDGWRVDILSAEMLLGSDEPVEWWYHVRPASLRDVYVGYVPASAVQVQR